MGPRKYNTLMNTTKKKHRYREQTSGYQWAQGTGRDTNIGCKIGYKDVLLSMGNIVDIL